MNDYFIVGDVLKIEGIIHTTFSFTVRLKQFSFV